MFELKLNFGATVHIDPIALKNETGSERRIILCRKES